MARRGPGAWSLRCNPRSTIRSPSLLVSCDCRGDVLWVQKERVAMRDVAAACGHSAGAVTQHVRRRNAQRGENSATVLR